MVYDSVTCRLEISCDLFARTVTDFLRHQVLLKADAPLLQHVANLLQRSVQHRDMSRCREFPALFRFFPGFFHKRVVDLQT